MIGNVNKKNTRFMKRFLQTFLFVISLLCLNSGDVSALQKARPIATDARIKTVRYTPNEVYRFVGHYGYHAIIELAEGEVIQNISVGDATSWNIEANAHRILIKPIKQLAETNMIVVTSKRLYHFELDATEVENISAKSLTFVMRFIYPEAYGAGFATSVVTTDVVPDIQDPEIRETLNFKYAIVGGDTVAPIRIFDDGEFTYFQFRDKNADIPAFFHVGPLGNEALINYRTRGDYIVVERVSPRFTLRHGSDIVCVFNETIPMPARPIMVDERSWFVRTTDALKFW